MTTSDNQPPGIGMSESEAPAAGSSDSPVHLQARFLAEASRILASSLDYETTLQSVAQSVVPHLADWCAVDMAGDDGGILRLAVAHIDPEKVKWARELHQKYPPRLDSLHGVPNVLRTGISEFYTDISDEMLVAGARDAGELNRMRAIGLGSVMIVPLTARGRTLGALTFVTTVESGRHYVQTDLALAEDLAQRAAIAVDNARLFREAEQALELHRVGEHRLTLLAEAAKTLLASLKLSELLPAILDLSQRLFSANAYALWRIQRDTDTWRVECQSGLSAEYAAAVLPGMGRGPLLLKAPLIVEDVDQASRLNMRADAYHKEGIKAVLIVPLNIHDQSSGTLAFYYHSPHKFSDMDVRVAVALANLAASAIGTAELYEEQSRLRLEAEAEVVERKRAEDALRKSEQRYRFLSDAMPQIVWSTRADGSSGSYNQRWYEYTGLMEQEAFSKERRDSVVHPDDVDAVNSKWSDSIRTGEPYEVEFRLKRKLDGAYRWHLGRGLPMRNADGNIGLWVGTCTDIDDQKLAEKEIARLWRQSQDAAVWQRVFLRDVLASVTGGRLRLCDSPAELPMALAPCGDPLEIRATTISEIRHLTMDAADAQGYPAERQQDLITAVSEAAMNAVVHAGGGEGVVCVGTEGNVQVWIRDHGQGINMEHLPRATLERGYTTAGTLGHGFWLMLATVDRLWLLSGPDGTTVVLEQDLVPPSPAWLSQK